MREYRNWMPRRRMAASERVVAWESREAKGFGEVWGFGSHSSPTRVGEQCQVWGGAGRKPLAAEGGRGERLRTRARGGDGAGVGG